MVFRKHFATKNTYSIEQKHSFTPFFEIRAGKISASTIGVALVEKRDVEKNPAWRVFSLGFGASVAVLKNLEDNENTKGGHEGMFGMFWYVLSFVNVLIFGTEGVFCIQDMMGRMKFITDVGHWRLQSYQLLKCLSSSMSPSWLPCVRTRCRSLLQKMLQPWLPESFNSPWLYMFNPCIQLAQDGSMQALWHTSRYKCHQRCLLS